MNKQVKWYNELPFRFMALPIIFAMTVTITLTLFDVDLIFYEVEWFGWFPFHMLSNFQIGIIVWLLIKLHALKKFYFKSSELKEFQ